MKLWWEKNENWLKYINYILTCVMYQNTIAAKINPAANKTPSLVAVPLLVALALVAGVDAVGAVVLVVAVT